MKTSSFEHFTVEYREQVVVVSLTDLDLLDRLITNELQDELVRFVETEKPTCLILDFQRVRRCSTEIINALLRARKRVTQSGGRMKLSNMRPEMREVFRLLNLDGTVFEIYNTISDAWKEF